MATSLNTINLNAATDVTKPIRSRAADMVANDGGGMGFATTDVTFLDRFLIIGSEGTFYVNAEANAERHSERLIELTERNPRLVLERVQRVVAGNLAKKPDYTLFALAILMNFAPAELKADVRKVIGEYVRTFTQLAVLVKFFKNTGGMGSAKRRVIRDWYERKSDNALANQMVKYRNREGFTHKDMLRISHAKPSAALARFALGENDLEALRELGDVPAVLDTFFAAQAVENESEMVALIKEQDNFMWELMPTKFLTSDKVWRALVMGGHVTGMALLRNLSRLAKMELLVMGSDTCDKVVETLRADAKRGVPIHPLNYLLALEGAGRSAYVSRKVSETLEDLLEVSLDRFGDTKSDKRVLIGLDVSASMTWETCVGAKTLTAAQASSVLTAGLLRRMPNSEAVGFSSDIVKLPFGAKSSYADVLSGTAGMPFGSTNLSRLLDYVNAHNIDVDSFVVISDNDINAGYHFSEGLEKYRRKVGHDVRLVLISTQTSWATVADPDDKDSLDVVGFDASVMSLATEFIEGKM